MTDLRVPLDERAAAEEARKIFEHEIGASVAEMKIMQAGNQPFLKFFVGKEAPIYTYALRETQKKLTSENPFRGFLALHQNDGERFPQSLEAAALLTLLTRSTRAVSEDSAQRGFLVPYVPFQNREDYQLSQSATHVVVGRRGVGKSTLIKRGVEILRDSAALVAVLDSQIYAALSGEDLLREVLHDVVRGFAHDASRASKILGKAIIIRELESVRDQLADSTLSPQAAVPRIKRALKEITTATGHHAFLFLDDFHVIEREEQPRIIQFVHGALKGANGWLKVAGIRSLLNYYSIPTKQGLQIPGDAQQILLDLTLENPEAAEGHLRKILGGFLGAVGYSRLSGVMTPTVFRRLAWASAGVPRDFLQMFARAIDHARRNRHWSVTLTDVNGAIGEFGQSKMDELNQDARNVAGELRRMLSALESYCLDENQINAFLLRSDDSTERRLVHTLSDLRLVHLISQSTTPDRAGERYEAYILDYSLFTGFRRRPNIKEMVPKDGPFKASQLRSLPKLSEGFLGKRTTANAKSKVQLMN